MRPDDDLFEFVLLAMTRSVFVYVLRLLTFAEPNKRFIRTTHKDRHTHTHTLQTKRKTFQHEQHKALAFGLPTDAR